MNVLAKLKQIVSQTAENLRKGNAKQQQKPPSRVRGKTAPARPSTKKSPAAAVAAPKTHAAYDEKKKALTNEIDGGALFDGVWDPATLLPVEGEAIYENGTVLRGKWENGEFVEGEMEDPEKKTLAKGRFQRISVPGARRPHYRIVEGSVDWEGGKRDEGKFAITPTGDAYLSQGKRRLDKGLFEGRLLPDRWVEGTWTNTDGQVNEGKWAVDPSTGFFFVSDGFTSFSDGTTFRGKRSASGGRGFANGTFCSATYDFTGRWTHPDFDRQKTLNIGILALKKRKTKVVDDGVFLTRQSRRLIVGRRVTEEAPTVEGCFSSSGAALPMQKRREGVLRFTSPIPVYCWLPTVIPSTVITLEESTAIQNALCREEESVALKQSKLSVTLLSKGREVTVKSESNGSVVPLMRRPLTVMEMMAKGSPAVYKKGSVEMQLPLVEWFTTGSDGAFPVEKLETAIAMSSILPIPRGEMGRFCEEVIVEFLEGGIEARQDTCEKEVDLVESSSENSSGGQCVLRLSARLNTIPRTLTLQIAPKEEKREGEDGTKTFQIRREFPCIEDFVLRFREKSNPRSEKFITDFLTANYDTTMADADSDSPSAFGVSEPLEVPLSEMDAWSATTAKENLAVIAFQHMCVALFPDDFSEQNGFLHKYLNAPPAAASASNRRGSSTASLSASNRRGSSSAVHPSLSAAVTAFQKVLAQSFTAAEAELSVVFVGSGAAREACLYQAMKFIRNARKVRLPRNWTKDKLLLVPMDSLEFKEISAQFAAGFPNHPIVSAHRVQNPVLWEKFHSKQREIAKENEGSSNVVRWLVHGTRKTDPKTLCENGFDPRYSEVGFFGRACYFAYRTSYSHAFRHTDENGNGQLIFACVACDRIEERSTADKSVKHPQHGCHSIRGPVSKGSDAIMTYELHQGYPEYLITYKP